MPEWRPIRWAVVAAVAAMLAVIPAAVRAQGGGDSSGEIDIGLDTFGVGGVVRPGEYVGLRLGLNDSAERPREVLVRVVVKDGDGDTILYQDAVTTNPGLRQPVWICFRLPFWFNVSSVLQVTAHAADEVSPAPTDPSLPRHTAGRLLGMARIPAPNAVLYSHIGMYGVIGRRLLGLPPYEGDPTASHLASGHERTEIVTINIDQLPDRWFALAQFDMIAWGEGQPGTLTPEIAQAVREWVQRGGHLVLIVPRVGQTWTDEATNPLYDITPQVRLERRDNVDLAAFEPIIRLKPQGTGRPLPEAETVHIFTPPTEAGWGEHVYPILNAPDGSCLVVRRLHGAGAVTMIGLDLNARFFSDNTLPRPELFWNRILGRRGVMLSEADFAPRLDGRPPTLFAPMGRDPVTLDRDFGGLIDRKEHAAAGVLIGFVVFVAYWLVAGPIGFFLLKRSGYAQHAWVAFLAAAGLFTAIAWGGAAAIRPSRVRAFHVTLLDHVYGQGWQRARAWVNVLTPVYGEAGVSIGDPQQRADAIPGVDRVHNVLSPWEPPGSNAGGGFPDARGYPLEARSPENVRFPARSTVKQFQVEWAGGPRWDMPAPQGPDGVGTLELLPSGEGKPVLSGVLKHKLPRALTDVTLIVVRGQLPLNPSLANPVTQPDTVLSNIFITKRQTAWAPGDAWDLSTIVQEKRDVPTRGDALAYLDRLLTSRQADDQIAGGTEGGSSIAERFNSLSLFGQLTPPDLGDTQRPRSERVAQRRLTHGWDLCRWFTQPCVIVIGQLGGDDDQPSPIPLYVDVGGGYREAPTPGRTLVRWVYPLPAAPPEYPPPRERETGEGGEGPG